MIKSLTEAVNGVTQLDALVMMADGNNGTHLTTYPQKLGRTNNRVVVTGAVHSAGNAWRYQSTANWFRNDAVGSSTNFNGTHQGSSCGPLTISETSFNKYPLRTSRERNSSDHGDRCARGDRCTGLPTYDRCQIQCEIYKKQFFGYRHTRFLLPDDSTGICGGI